MTPPPLRVLSVVWNLIRGGTEGQCARTALAHTAAGNIHRVAGVRLRWHAPAGTCPAEGPLQARVQALVDVMEEFSKKHG